VTNSRDTQEVLFGPGKEILRIFTTFQSKTSILDDFTFYDKRQEIMQEKKIQETDTPIEQEVDSNTTQLYGPTENKKKNAKSPQNQNLVQSTYKTVPLTEILIPGMDKANTYGQHHVYKSK